LRQLEGKTKSKKYKSLKMGEKKKIRIRNTTIKNSLKIGSVVEWRDIRNLKWYDDPIWMNNEKKTSI
jgi:hypothetical protein